PAGYSSASYCLYNLNQKDIYPYVTVPTMVICGVDDKVTPVSESEYIHNHIPNSRISLIPKAGHLCFIEAPTEFRNNVMKFFMNNYRKGNIECPIINIIYLII